MFSLTLHYTHLLGEVEELELAETISVIQQLTCFPYQKDLYEHYVENGRGTRLPNGFINYDAVVATNRANAQPYTGSISGYAGARIGSNGFRNDGVSREIMIRRASMNSHDWVGAISSLDIQSGKFNYSIGVDLRSYTRISLQST